ncbi:MAG TPA: hotdog fold domain-containing protein [Longimicrobiaceae bacterium]|nr:hotdog fold domain-containing protein [Longimicrobiaceae bacterium]
MSSTNRLRRLWDKLHPLPGGDRVFSILLGRLAPYTGSIRPRVRELGEGYCRVEMADRRAVRNHLNSIHAIALANLGEVASGLALMYSLPPEARAILVEISIAYLKKARGTLTAECRTSLPDFRQVGEHEMETLIRDDSGDEVARARARWLIGPRE